MTPDELTRLRELEASAYQEPLKVRTGCMGDLATIDITTEDEAYPPFARLWCNTLMGFQPLPPHDAVVEKLVGSYNALPGLLDHIDRLTRRLEIYEARLGRVARHHPEAYAQALAGDTQ